MTSLNANLHMTEKWNDLHSDIRFRPRYPHDQVIRWFFRNFPESHRKDTTLLDLGCGAGRHALFFASHDVKTHACDISDVGVNELLKLSQQANLDISTALTSADNLSMYSSNSFDGVCCFGVLYYLSFEGAQTAISEIHRILKPNGKLLLVVRTNEDSRRLNSVSVGENTWVVKLDGKNAPSMAEDSMKMLFFSYERLSSLLAENFDISINRMTFQFDSFIDDNWVVYCSKKI